MMSITKICPYCGKQFSPKGRNASRQKYCEGPHYTTCQVCGKQIEIKNIGAYGVPKTCSRECTNKLKHINMMKTMKSKYGATNPSQIKEFRDKADESKKQHSKESDEKRRKTMIERYGVAYPMQSEELRAKIESTNIKRYGATNPSKNSEIQDKIREHHLSEEYKEAYRKTSRNHYGTDFPAQSEEIQNKMKETCRKRYGHDYAIQNESIKMKMSETMRKQYEANPALKEKLKNSIHQACLASYGVDWPCQLPQCREASNHSISNQNREFGERLQNLGFDITYEKHIESYSYDVCIESLKVVIELDPTYTHNSIGNHWSSKGKSITYHKDKSGIAANHGYRCIHVFDWDDKDKILSLLINQEHIYGRKCDIKRVSRYECDKFLNSYHLQGSCRGQSYRYGLYHDGELVSVMTFGEPRYTKKYNWELLRLCTKPGIVVLGGPNKMIKRFIHEADPSSIISYCDISKFSGSVYNNLGFKQDHMSPPAKVWSKNNRKINDTLLRQRGYDQLFGTSYGKGTSNEELMIQNGWLPVYDCGQAVYVWGKEQGSKFAALHNDYTDVTSEEAR